MSQARFTSNHTVGVLMGGLSPERGISLKSGKAVATALRSKGYTVQEIIVDQNIAQTLRENPIDVAWLALHGAYGEDGCIQGLLEILRIPYTSSGVQACSVSMHKTRTKQMLRHSDVCLSKDAIWSASTDFPVGWQAPCVIKDPLGGSSIGIWVCKTTADLKKAIQECQTLGGTYLLEEFVHGMEITVALFNGEALPVITIIPHTEFFDLKAKYTKGETTYLAPSTVEECISIESKIPITFAKDAQKQAMEAYRALGMRGVCRADFIVPCIGKYPEVQFDPSLRPVFLEMNAIPGMTETSLTPMAAQVMGISFADLTERLLQQASLENPTPTQA